MNLYYIFIAIFILILIIFLVYWFSSSKTSPQDQLKSVSVTPSSVGSRFYTPISPYVLPTQKLLSAKDDKVGSLYDVCPCADNLVCFKGICRKPVGSPCLFNRECGTENCVIGKCIDKLPYNDNAEKICLHSQLVKLDKNNKDMDIVWAKFINVLDLFKHQNLYYIITKDGVFDENEHKLQTNIVIKKLFKYFDQIYALNDENKLFILENQDHHWLFSPLPVFLNYNLADVDILDVYSHKGSKEIVFYVEYVHKQREIIYYHHNKWYHRPDLKSIVYLDKWENRLEISSFEVTFYYNNNILNKLALNMLYREVVYNKNGLYLATGHEIYYYRPNSGGMIPDKIQEIRNIKMMTLDNNVWLVLDSYCVTK